MNIFFHTFDHTITKEITWTLNNQVPILLMDLDPGASRGWCYGGGDEVWWGKGTRHGGGRGGYRGRGMVGESGRGRGMVEGRGCKADTGDSVWH